MIHRVPGKVLIADDVRAGSYLVHGLHGVYGKVLIADMSEQDPT